MNGRNDPNQIFEGQEDDLEILLNLKKDTDQPLLGNLGGSEETPEQIQNPVMCGRGSDGNNKNSNFNDKSQPQPELSGHNKVSRPTADLGGRDVPRASEETNNASKRVYKTECKNKTDSIEANRSNDLSGKSVSLETPYKLMQTPPKNPENDKLSGRKECAHGGGKREECKSPQDRSVKSPVSKPAGKQNTPQPSEPVESSPETSPDFWGRQ